MTDQLAYFVLPYYSFICYVEGPNLSSIRQQCALLTLADLGVNNKPSDTGLYIGKGHKTFEFRQATLEECILFARGANPLEPNAFVTIEKSQTEP